MALLNKRQMKVILFVLDKNHHKTHVKSIVQQQGTNGRPRSTTNDRGLKSQSLLRYNIYLVLYKYVISLS